MQETAKETYEEAKGTFEQIKDKAKVGPGVIYIDIYIYMYVDGSQYSYLCILNKDECIRRSTRTAPLERLRKAGRRQRSRPR